jgi:catechol 2,3-dioxygenase-like lactoylglutathione lyase family enzyme
MTNERVQLAINVADIDESIAFYSRLFNANPTKTRPGYANFQIAEPPLKLVLIQGGEPGTLNHLGVEVADASAVAEAAERLAAAGMATRAEENTTCCYAVQDKVWVAGPAGEQWEIYTVLNDAGAEYEGSTKLAGDGRRPIELTGSGCC